MVIAGLITAASTAPISAYVAYAHHVEAMERLAIDGRKPVRETETSARQRIEDRRATCAQAMTLLGDETMNPSLPVAERQRLLSDLRRTASSCMRPLVEDESGAGS